MKNEITFTAKQVGERVKERRTELNLTMPELGKRIGVNKSTIQRYEADGVDPKRTMIIKGLAEALLTTPEWLTGLSDDKEYDSRTICENSIEEHITAYLESVTQAVQGEPRQQMLTNFLGEFIDMYAIVCKHFARAMAEADKIAQDEGLKESLKRYAIESGEITEKAYHNEMEAPIEDMKKMLDCLLHIYDNDHKNHIGELLQIKLSAEQRLAGKENSVAK